MASSSTQGSGDITRLIRGWRGGDAEAGEELFEAVYQELRRMARLYLRKERRDHSLAPTALVHEVYLRLADQDRVDWQDRAHFFALAAQAMRRILVDHARRLAYAKREGRRHEVPLEVAGELEDAVRSSDLIALDDALAELAQLDDAKARVVELRFFGGLTNDEAAAVLGCSKRTIVRHWRLAKAWLHQRMSGDHPDGSNPSAKIA